MVIEVNVLSKPITFRECCLYLHTPLHSMAAGLLEDSVGKMLLKNRAFIWALILRLTILRPCCAITELELNSSITYTSEMLRNITSIREQIMDHLFENYQKHERPGANEKLTTEVTVYITITAITSVDVRMMEYTTDLLLRQEWKDPRLAWNGIPRFKNYTKNLVSPELKRKLWLPDLFFRNGKEGRLHKMTCPNYLTRIDPSGMILYSQKITMRFSCQMNLKTFPMDSQECHINIGSYGYHVDELRFVWRNDTPVHVDSGMQISEFNSPEQVSSTACTADLVATNERASCLDAAFVLSRQLGSWLSSVYIPNFLIVVASWHSFWVDIDAQPARVSLGLLTLLGLITQASGVSSSLPRVSYIKAIDVWNIACIIFNVSVLIEFALASNMARKDRVTDWRIAARKTMKNELANWCENCRNSLLRSSILGGHRITKSTSERTKQFRQRQQWSSEIISLLEILFPEQVKKAKLTATKISVGSESVLAVAIQQLKIALLSEDQQSEGNECSRESDDTANTFALADNKDDNNDGNDCGKIRIFGKKNRISTIDGYSRLIFPGCFLIYNCCYWLYYLVLMKKV